MNRPFHVRTPSTECLQVRHDSPVDAEEILSAYRRDLLTLGVRIPQGALSRARSYLKSSGVHNLRELRAESASGGINGTGDILAWLILTNRVRASAEFLVASRIQLGRSFARHFPAIHSEFTLASRQLQYSTRSTAAQWSALAKTAALSGISPNELTEATIESSRVTLCAAIARRRITPSAAKQLTRDLCRARRALRRCGVLPARCATPAGIWARNTDLWNSIPPLLAAGVRDYLTRKSPGQTLATARQTESTLLRFSSWLTKHSSIVTSPADIRESHVREFGREVLVHVRGNADERARQLSRSIQIVQNYMRDSHRLEEAGSFPGLVCPPDLFRQGVNGTEKLGSANLSSLVSISRLDPDPFVAYCVEILLRTGLRRSEFLTVTTRDVVPTGASCWLRIRSSRSRSQFRYVLVPPEVQSIIETRLAQQRANPDTDRLFVDGERMIDPRRLDRVLVRIFKAAGLGRPVSDEVADTMPGVSLVSPTAPSLAPSSRRAALPLGLVGH